MGLLPIAAGILGAKKVSKVGSKIDPTKVAKADVSGMQGVSARMGAQADKFFATQVPLHEVGPIGAKSFQAATVDQGQGFRELQGNVRTAEGNIAGAGVMNPQIAAYLAAAQQQGQYSPQAFQMMQQAATGQGPSAAQAQMASGIDSAIKAQMAAAGSRGFSAAAMRGAQMQGAEMQQQAVNQAAILRAQEQQAAQQAFLQASLDQENMARTAALQAGATTLQADIAGKQARQAAINAALEGSGQMANLGQQRANLQAQLLQDARAQNAQLSLQGQIARENALLDAAALQQSGQLGYGQLGANMLSGQLGGQQAMTTLEQGRLNQSAQARSGLAQSLGGGMIGAGGSVLAALAMSDREAKKDIAANKETQSFLSALTDNQYRYKDTSQPGTAEGVQYGPMAQDLMKTKMGRTAVIKTPDGLMVDSARGFLLALSGLANINKRLSALEAR